MKLILPDYYKKFKCIAEKCKDNCCIGWGIYIDDSTAEKYKKQTGNFGERLRKNIDSENQCFINDSLHRCPFLNKNNLCEIILTIGEENLCEICDRHPRYFEWFDDAIEGGIGLCCEEAARIILNADGFSTYETDAPESLCCYEDDEPCDEIFYIFLKKSREKIINLLLDESIPLEKSLEMLIFYAELMQDKADEYEINDTPEIIEKYRTFDIKEAVEIMLDAEVMDDTQEKYFQMLYKFLLDNPEADNIHKENEKELRNIAVYFIWRYLMKAVFSGNLYNKIMLCVFSVKIINLMFNFEKAESLEKKCDIAKRFSKIIEYSEENLFLIYESYEY